VSDKEQPLSEQELRDLAEKRDKLEVPWEKEKVREVSLQELLALGGKKTDQIAVVQAGKTPERVIVLPSSDFDALKGREGYRQRANGDLERVEGSLAYVIVRQQSSPSLLIGT
jgi:hypothetical protein